MIQELANDSIAFYVRFPGILRKNATLIFLKLRKISYPSMKGHKIIPPEESISISSLSICREAYG